MSREFGRPSNNVVGEVDQEPAVTVAAGAVFGMVCDLSENDEWSRKSSPFRTNGYLPHGRPAATNSLPKAETAIPTARANPLVACRNSLQGQQVLPSEGWASVSCRWRKNTSREPARDLGGRGLGIKRTVRSPQPGLKAAHGSASFQGLEAMLSCPELAAWQPS